MSKRITLKRAALAGACAAGLLASGQASAANWLMLQGVENPKAPDQYLFAFVQPAYTTNKGDKIQGQVGLAAAAGNNGQYAAPNTVAPDFNETSQVYLRRARIGSRGKFSGAWKNDFTAKMNYFFLLALDDGLFNQNQFSTDRDPVNLDHASLTFNHIPGARIRAGLFKNPSSEEVFQAVQTIDFIEFTSFGRTHVLETFYAGNDTPVGNTVGSNPIGTPQLSAYGFSAARDWGVQVFDSFKVANKSWDLSYAVKVGRGEAISRNEGNANNSHELYLYASAEKDLPGGKGPRKNGIKFYGWYQDGEREFSTDPGDQTFDRTRYGVGVKALGKFFGSKYKHRFAAEAGYAEGMIFMGPAGGVAGNLPVAFAVDDDNKARGFQVEYGFYLDKNWQFDVRWSREDRLYERSADINPGAEREITETTLGVTYHFTPKARLTFNYDFRDVEVPNAYDGSTGAAAGPINAFNTNANIAADSIGDRIGLQLTYIF